MKRLLKKLGMSKKLSQSSTDVLCPSPEAATLTSTSIMTRTTEPSVPLSVTSASAQAIQGAGGTVSV